MSETLSTKYKPAPFPKLHSEEVQEIISRPPHWLVRWGITLFFVLTVLLGLGTWWIRYPDIVTTPFTLTATNAPRVIVVRTEGKLGKLLIRDGQRVNKGQAVAYSESTASPEQVVQLARSMEQLSLSATKGQWASVIRFSNVQYTSLGEIQNDFQTFNQQLTELKSFLAGGFFLQKQKLLLDDRNDLVAMEHILAEQLVLQDKDLELAKDEFQVQEKLHQGKVISSLEYKREKAKVLSREMPVKNLAASLIQNRSAQTAKQKELLELENSIQERKSNFLQSLQTLRSNIENWKLRYILTAPVAGTASFSAPWQEQQHLTSGQELMLIEPQTSSFRGLVKLPQANLGKVLEGQAVLIKMDGFPYREYGMLEGKLARPSLTPGKDTAYWAYVDLPFKLKTRYGKDLPYRNGLKGTAEIITADRRLLERLVSTLRSGGK
ncbi:HlyD family efflux transporter periplasmic adaptor subunit [Dyadobacter psychrotolerans]|uniref:HlyD family efflux transporter periplasmic adaptor subunit n=1 Tax=Dyadobacter psychrotolerans TaxID=2541721 RepID=A0A4R5E0H3_9BACT|nr:HlyD family efflux transporter periplasmic adaptor subunit [Dyadobacter psychrotolerans]TDE17063.1 HlyD family efflux transporter periplasmic adaptor subunit [Dyadobacter psychrotolerans]